MLTPRVPIAQEGYPFICFSAFATLIAAILDYDLLTIPLILITTFIMWFFRDPERIAPERADALISPADGRIIEIEKVFDDKFLHEHVYKISIFMNIFSVHVNRAPFDGEVEKIIYSPGSFYSADSARGALKNENCAIITKNKVGNRIAFVQVAGLIARRIVCWLETGDIIKKGQRFGLIRFGSRVDLYLPTSTNLEIKTGQKVKAGESVLGYMTGF